MKMKKGRRFKSSFKMKQKGIEVIGKWKTVQIDPNLFADEEFKDIVCLEELREYKLVSSSKVGKVKDKKRKAESVSEEQTEEEELLVPPKKKKKNKDLKSKTDKSNDPNATQIDVPVDKEAKCNEIIQVANLEDQEHVAESTSSTKDAPRKKKKKAAKNKGSQAQEALPSVITSKKVKNWTTEVLSASTDHKADVSAWKDLFVPEPVLRALSYLGFSAPTPIQALALPSAIRDNMDVLGAAETGTDPLNWLYMLGASHLPSLNAGYCYRFLYVAEKAFIRRRACICCISNILVMIHCEVLKLCSLQTQDFPSIQ